MSDNHQFAQVVQKAHDRILDAYNEACRCAGRALDPAEMGLPGWACDLLAEAYEYELTQEDGRIDE